MRLKLAEGSSSLYIIITSVILCGRSHRVPGRAGLISQGEHQLRVCTCSKQVFIPVWKISVVIAAAQRETRHGIRKDRPESVAEHQQSVRNTQADAVRYQMAKRKTLHRPRLPPRSR